MCAIAGWVDFTRGVVPDARVVQGMVDTMRSRGPDDDGVWADEFVALGHCRLSVIDPVGGQQPFVAVEDGRVTAALTYAGEIYNAAEVRSELSVRGHNFHTRSDTEVVLRAFLEWESACAEHLDGMFAFAAWDPRRAELTLVRDRLGIKPLHYYRTPTGVLFASEPKALLAHPRVEARLSIDGLREAIALFKTPGTTMFDGIREIEPGTTMRVSLDGDTSQRYWCLSARDHDDSPGDTAIRVRELLDDSVRRQLVADVPWCVLLSGGLDSSAITALAVGRTPSHLVRSYGLGFEGEAAGFRPDVRRMSLDGPYAAEVADHLGTDHTLVELTVDELTSPDLREQVVRAQDAPSHLGDLNASLLLLARRLRMTSTVALSGEGADEIFGGYRWFHDNAAIAGEWFPWRDPPVIGAQIRAFTQGSSHLLDIDSYAKDSYRQAIAQAPKLDGENRQERRMREITYLHLARYLQVLLDRKDRMSMACGVEMRVPFCDHRLVEYLFNVPWKYKAADGREKTVLREAMAPLLPASVCERRKCPYPAARDPAYERALRSELDDLLSDPTSPVAPMLDARAVRAMSKQLVEPEARIPNRAAIELVLSLNTWLRVNRPRIA